MIMSFNNNEDKFCSLFKDDVGGSRVESRAKLHHLGLRDHGVTIVFFSGVSSNKQFNCLKRYFASR